MPRKLRVCVCVCAGMLLQTHSGHLFLTVMERENCYCAKLTKWCWCIAVCVTQCWIKVTLCFWTVTEKGVFYLVLTQSDYCFSQWWMKDLVVLCVFAGVCRLRSTVGCFESMKTDCHVWVSVVISVRPAWWLRHWHQDLLFVPVSLTLTLFKGHIGVRQLKLKVGFLIIYLFDEFKTVWLLNT